MIIETFISIILVVLSIKWTIGIPKFQNLSGGIDKLMNILDTKNILSYVYK